MGFGVVVVVGRRVVVGADVVVRVGAGVVVVVVVAGPEVVVDVLVLWLSVVVEPLPRLPMVFGPELEPRTALLTLRLFWRGQASDFFTQTLALPSQQVLTMQASSSAQSLERAQACSVLHSMPLGRQIPSPFFFVKQKQSVLP